MLFHHKGMKRGAADSRSVGTDPAETEGRGQTEWREAYQSDDGGSGSGTRYDVQVVGQVELKR